MTKKNYLPQILAVFILAAATGVFLSQMPKETSPVIFESKAAEPVIPETSEVRTGDGTIKLIHKKEKQADGMVKHSFQVIDSEDMVIDLFEQTLAADGSVSLPFNSWSPDNKKLFIQVNNDFYVFKASGELFPNGQKYLSINEYWNKKAPKYNIKTASGWASPDLIVIHTTTPEGENGYQFWFETSSHSIMQLAR